MLAPLFTATSACAGQLLARDVVLDAGHRQRAGRLGDRARVLEDVLDRGADLVGVTSTISSTYSRASAKRFLADAPHGDAVGEDPDALERDALAGS